MGIFLIIIGLGWAIIGFGNIIFGIKNIIETEGSEFLSLANLIINMVFFVIPGLITSGIGVIIKKKRGVKLNLKKCPKCAEEVRAEALICRFCNYEFPAPPSPEEPKPIEIGEKITHKTIDELWKQKERVLKNKWG